MIQQIFQDSRNQQLSQIIYDQIISMPEKRITFADYMELVLYHPDHGYYANNQVNIGKQGDFFTSSHLGADFGELLAEQFVDIWHKMDRPAAFTILEMGAGQGIFAQDVLHYLNLNYPDFFQCLQYLIIEKSPGLKNAQKQHLTPWSNVKWSDWEQLDDHSLIGCLFSNELVDAFPVHQFMLNQKEMKEIYLTAEITATGKIKFIEVYDHLSTSKIREYFDLIKVDISAYDDGYRSEVNLAALDWIKTISQKLKQGYIITIDYGYPAHRYYNPQRQQGTLQCYYQHAQHSNPYINIGRQDLTAHVDFTSLIEYGNLCQLELIGMTQQCLFLMALGIGDRLAILSQTDTKLDLITTLRRRDVLQQLIAPMGLGGFTVLIQGKGLDQFPNHTNLKGLQISPLDS